jgi:phosphodiesterase/alkaline phosphatase D-like protein
MFFPASRPWWLRCSRSEVLGPLAAASRVGLRHDRPEVITLADYRHRHALYKTDPALQAVHAALPMIATWDDHAVDTKRVMQLARGGAAVEAGARASHVA